MQYKVIYFKKINGWYHYVVVGPRSWRIEGKRKCGKKEIDAMLAKLLLRASSPVGLSGWRNRKTCPSRPTGSL